MDELIRELQVNIPFTWLWNDYLDLFIEHRLNPEIGLDAEALEKHTTAEFEKVAEALHREGLRITLHGPYMDLSPGSSDSAVRDITRRRFEQVLKLIPVFKPATVVCHAGYDRMRYEYIREEWLENSLEIWTWLGQRVTAAGSRLMLENVYEHGPEEIAFLFDCLETRQFGFCLDIGHQSAFGRAGLDKWLESLGPVLGQVHLHDNNGQKDEHLALGGGSVKIDLFFDYLFNKNKSGIIITLEPHEKEALWASLAYLKENKTFQAIMKRQPKEGRN